MLKLDKKAVSFGKKIFFALIQFLCLTFFSAYFSDLSQFFYFKYFLYFVTMSSQIIHILHNCLSIEYNFTVLRVGSKLLSVNPKDMHEAKRRRVRKETQFSQEGRLLKRLMVCLEEGGDKKGKGNQ